MKDWKHRFSMQEKITLRQIMPEVLIYVTLWGLLFCAPIMAGVYDLMTNEEETMQWGAVGRNYIIILFFFILFLIHNFLLLPLLFKKRKVSAYILATLLVTFLFMTGVTHYALPPLPSMRMEHRMVPPPPLPKGADSLMVSQAHPWPNDTAFIAKHHHRHHPAEDGFLPLPGPKFFFHIPFFGHLILSLFMLMFNLVITFYFRSERDRETMKELEHERLSSELEYLKYQINPHFFMNTLNNIHALVDIDKEKAQEAILTLSQMMRYVLYETSLQSISLSHEVKFLQSYIELMKLRYSEKVDIQVNFPAVIPPVNTPPLLFISLVENAFKHGVSYHSASYIHISMTADTNRIEFVYENSKQPDRKEDNHSGIGLENIYKRLQLIFGSDYKLDITEEDKIYHVLLNIPSI